MSKPFMQLYVGDYLADTLDLTTEQHGAYLLLLMTMWRHGAKLPNDHKKLARIARVSPRRWKGVWAEIERFFYADGETIRNKRLDQEHQKAVSISEKRSASGAKGGAAKALKNNKQDLASATDLPPTLPQHSQKPESYSSSIGKDRGTREAEQTDRERLLAAAGADPGSGMIGPNGKMLGREIDMIEARKWSDMGLTIEQQCAIIAETVQRGVLPHSFRYFTPAMADAAAAQSAPAPQGRISRQIAQQPTKPSENWAPGAVIPSERVADDMPPPAKKRAGARA